MSSHASPLSPREMSSSPTSPFTSAIPLSRNFFNSLADEMFNSGGGTDTAPLEEGRFMIQVGRDDVEGTSLSEMLGGAVGGIPVSGRASVFGGLRYAMGQKGFAKKDPLNLWSPALELGD